MTIKVASLGLSGYSARIEVTTSTDSKELLISLVSWERAAEPLLFLEQQTGISCVHRLDVIEEIESILDHHLVSIA